MSTSRYLTKEVCGIRATMYMETYMEHKEDTVLVCGDLKTE